ncbi:MAG: chloride channel protein [Butyricicoccus sp.]|nr:chloride channel protein [Butyricicoccus sp.]
MAKWTILALAVGIVVGVVGAVFAHAVTWATATRKAHGWLLYFLPFAGVFIVWLYRRCGMAKDTGTNRVLRAVRRNGEMPLRTAPLIIVSTVLTHLFGGSSGREGAALQMGAALSAALNKVIPLDRKDDKIIKMCGMSAGFSALFSTPLAATVFAMECVTVGKMHYAAIYPCLLSALIAQMTALLLGGHPETFALTGVPDLTAVSVVQAAVLGICCALIARLFCWMLGKAHHLYHHYLPNPYTAVFAGGCLVIVLTLIVGTRDYNGAGMDVIEHMLHEGASPIAFLLKIVFTALTLACGFKGGEIVPAFFTGAAFGAAFGGLLGMTPSFAGGVCMVAVFCGVTNAPLASLVLAYELFGGVGLPLIFLAIALSFLLSGYSSLYSEQVINYGKLAPEYIGKTAGELTEHE